jgi:hypothetical protein
MRRLTIAICPLPRCVVRGLLILFAHREEIALGAASFWFAPLSSTGPSKVFNPAQLL